MINLVMLKNSLIRKSQKTKHLEGSTRAYSTARSWGAGTRGFRSISAHQRCLEWSLLTIRRFGIPRSVKVHPGPSHRTFDTIDRKLEEVEWLLNCARNANKPIPVASAITTKKVNAPRRLTQTRLLNPVTHRQTTKSAYVSKINSEALISPYL